MTRNRIAKSIRRILKSFGIFECLTISILVVYLYYVSVNVILVSGHAKAEPTMKPKSLFKILKTNKTLTFVDPPTSVEKCSVIIAVILCEDDRYLSIKNKTFQPQGNNTTEKSTLPIFRGSIAKDFSRQINQTLVLMKSVAILTKYDKTLSPHACVEFLLLADKPTHYKVIKQEIRNKWSVEFQKLVKVTNIPVRYPPGSSWMRKLFRPCATLRLFLAEILPESVDSIIYVDTDVIFFQSVQELWAQFEGFDEGEGDKAKEYVPRKLASMAPCLFHYGSAANSIPYFGNSGLNAGIMLMNLTRMRTSQWTNKIRMVTTMFQDKIKLADQDILNIYFHFFPEELQLLTCDWNFRPFQCREGSYCPDPELSQGISALHGNALSFTAQGPEPLFHAVFKTFHGTKLNEHFTLKAFVKLLEMNLVKAEETAHLSTSHCKRYGGLDVLLLNRLYGLVEQ